MKSQKITQDGRLDDPRKVRRLPLRRSQGKGDRPPAAGLHGQRGDDEHHPRDGRRRLITSKNNALSIQPVDMPLLENDRKGENHEDD